MNDLNLPPWCTVDDIDAQFGDEPEVKEEKEPECEYGHMCTSSCGNDKDCPCGNEHCCSISVSERLCDGTCDDCIRSEELKGRSPSALNKR